MTKATIVDLRSDTVTRPGEGMYRTMKDARVVPSTDLSRFKDTNNDPGCGRI